MDLVSYVPRMPVVGETLHGHRFTTSYGGKGANQAVMAGLMGVDVCMIGKLGDDAYGKQILEHYKRIGLDTSHIHVTSEASTGVAPITVDDNGNNSIVIIMGANDLLTEEELEAARPVMREAALVVCQLEIPLAITTAALRIAREEGALTVLNPAPGRGDIPDSLFCLTDILVPNETETELLLGAGTVDVNTDDGCVAAARMLCARGVGSVVITLGERGCLVVNGAAAEPRFITPPKVKAVDTVGAGDSFLGALAAILSARPAAQQQREQGGGVAEMREAVLGGGALEDACGRAVGVASISVTREGAQSSYPARDELPADILTWEY